VSAAKVRVQQANLISEQFLMIKHSRVSNQPLALKNEHESDLHRQGEDAAAEGEGGPAAHARTLAALQVRLDNAMAVDAQTRRDRTHLEHNCRKKKKQSWPITPPQSLTTMQHMQTYACTQATATGALHIEKQHTRF
jgi:hypothetical protein